MVVGLAAIYETLWTVWARGKHASQSEYRSSRPWVELLVDQIALSPQTASSQIQIQSDQRPKTWIWGVETRRAALNV